MPIAPAAKGLIILTPIVIAAGVALYENEQVQEWLQATGRKFSSAWDDIVNFERRQYERRRQMHAPMMQGAGQRGSAPGELQDGERRQARRTLYENAEVRQSRQQEVADTAGVRRRRARDASESLEALIDRVGGSHMEEDEEKEEEKREEKHEVLFHRQEPSLLDPADSVLDVTSGVPNTWTTPGPESAKAIEQPIVLKHQNESATSANTVDNSSDPTSEPRESSRPASPSAALASSHLTVSIPVQTLSDSHLTPTTLAGSPGGFTSTPGSESPVTVHTPPADDDEEFETLSVAGTETASHLSMSSDRLRQSDEEDEDEMRSVMSESGMSGWSEVGSEG